MNTYRIIFNKRILIILLFCLLSKTIHAGDYQFRYNMKKGDSFKYKYISVIKGTSNTDGKKKNEGSTTMMIFTLTVDEISGRGNFICTVRIDSISYDADNSDKETWNQVYKKFEGKRVKLTLSQEGKTLSSVNLDNVDIPQPGIKAAIKLSLSPANMLNLPRWTLPEGKLKMNVPVKNTHIDTTRQPEYNSTIITKIITEHNLCGNIKIGQYNCQKIIMNITEISDGKSFFKGVSSHLKYNSKKKITSYFAPVEGILVQSSEDETSLDELNSFENNEKSNGKYNHKGKSTFLLLR